MEPSLGVICTGDPPSHGRCFMAAELMTAELMLAELMLAERMLAEP